MDGARSVHYRCRTEIINPECHESVDELSVLADSTEW